MHSSCIVITTRRVADWTVLRAPPRKRVARRQMDPVPKTTETARVHRSIFSLFTRYLSLQLCPQQEERTDSLKVVVLESQRVRPTCDGCDTTCHREVTKLIEYGAQTNQFEDAVTPSCQTHLKYLQQWMFDRDAVCSIHAIDPSKASSSRT